MQQKRTVAATRYTSTKPITLATGVAAYRLQNSDAEI